MSENKKYVRMVLQNIVLFYIKFLSCMNIFNVVHVEPKTINFGCVARNQHINNENTAVQCEDNMDISNYKLNYCLLSRMTVFFMIKKCLQMQSWSWKSLLFFTCILLNMQAISACRSSITKLGIRFTKGPHARNVIRRGEYLFIYIYSHTCI